MQISHSLHDWIIITFWNSSELVLSDVLCFVKAKYVIVPIKQLKSALVDFYSVESLSEAKVNFCMILKLWNQWLAFLMCHGAVMAKTALPEKLTIIILSTTDDEGASQPNELVQSRRSKRHRNRTSPQGSATTVENHSQQQQQEQQRRRRPALYGKSTNSAKLVAAKKVEKECSFLYWQRQHFLLVWRYQMFCQSSIN